MPTFRAIRPDALRSLRETSGMTVTELAKRAGLSRGYLSRLEHGHYRGTARSARALAYALGCSVQTIADFNGIAEAVPA